MTGFYKFAIGLMRCIMPMWYHIETEGLENLPEEGGYLFISNHRSNADPILIGTQNPDTQFCFLAKQELFSDGLVGWLLKKLGAVAIDRGTGDVTALEEIAFRLENGDNALIFPEGTRSKDGKLGHFKTGAALIAAQTGVPVVPVAISFEDELHFRSRIVVRYGQPFTLPKTDPHDPSPAVLKQIRREMTDNVSALLTEIDEESENAAPKALPEKAAELPAAESTHTEETMSKKNRNNKKNPAAPVPEQEPTLLTDEPEDEISEVESILSGAPIIDPKPADVLPETDDADSKKDDADTAPADDSAADDAEEQDTEAAAPFSIKNPFKKLGKVLSSDDDSDEETADPLDSLDDELDALSDYSDDTFTEDESFAEEESVDDEEDEDEAAGFKLWNPFRKKKPAADAIDDSDYEADEEEEYDEDDDEAVVGRDVDFGRIALILTFVILGIFAIDFCKRLYDDWRGSQGMLNIQSGTSSEVDSMMPETTEPAVSDVTQVAPIVTLTSTTTTTEITADVTGEEGTTTTQTTVQRSGETVSVSNGDVKKGSMILVDSTHALQAAPNSIIFKDIPYQHLRLVRTDLSVDSSLSTPICQWFNDFYAATGLGNIMVYSTTETPQSNPYSVNIPERASGLTLDFSILNEAASTHSPYTPDGNYAWLNEHAAEYGFIQRYPASKSDKTGMDGLTWHFRYVGVPHALYMKEHDLCLEEYIDTVHNHSWNGEHLTVTSGSLEYEIYYVPASEADSSTDIPYAAGAEPIISGDNEEGFIVAYAKP